MRRRVTFRLGAVILIEALLVLGANGMVGASPAHGHPAGQRTASPAGTYNYSDSLGDSLQMTLSNDNTASMATGCTGAWVQSKKTISVDLDSSTCRGENVQLVGTVKGKKVSGSGDLLNPQSPPPLLFTWQATKA